MALVPLVIATLWLGKTLSMRQAAIEASLALAFECTVRPADCTDPAGQAQLADELRRRTFSRIDAPIRSHDTLGDQPSAG